jgi:hypothetical protein
VLAVSLAAEGTSWARAVRQTRSDAREARLTLLRYFRESRDPNVKMVLFEDTAALVGIALAFAGLLLDQRTGSDMFDPVASIAIGLLLVGVAGAVTEVFLDATTARGERSPAESRCGPHTAAA